VLTRVGRRGGLITAAKSPGKMILDWAILVSCFAIMCVGWLIHAMDLGSIERDSVINLILTCLDMRCTLIRMHFPLFVGA
jgi:hypothetical protein